LILAPNIAVYERLKQDFENGNTFKIFPLIPDEYLHLWDMQTILGENVTSKNSNSVIYLSNIQKFYERSDPPMNPVEELVGKKPSNSIKTGDYLINAINSLDNISVINDEAHHVWDKDILWHQLIDKLFDSFNRDGKNFSFQLDFTATPKRQDTGSLFGWIVTDFPLADAINSGIVKRPIIGEVENPVETPSERADVVYRDYIEGAIRRWKYYDDKMTKVNKKPILFVMATKTKEANEIKEYLETKKEFRGRTLLIHTDLKGDVSEKEWIQLKKDAREIDNGRKYSAIVSVLMLREGWDVKNVTVILGLRPYTSKAEILPEQTLGRGLRLMFGTESGYEETVDVFGTKAFVDFIDEEMKKQGVELQRFKERNLPEVTNIFVDVSKIQYNFEIPVLSPKFKRENRSFKEIDIYSLPAGKFNLELEQYLNERRSHGVDALTQEEKWRDRWIQPIPENYESVVSYITNLILRSCKIPSRNSELVSIVDSYITHRLFTRTITPEIKADYRFLLNLSETKVTDFLIKLFVGAVNKLSINVSEVKFSGEVKEVKSVEPSLTRKKTYVPKKCVLNKIPVANNFEYDFCKFLDDAEDVEKFIKNDVYLNFYLEFVNSNKALSYYQPDFLIETTGGYLMVETKGREDPDVILKDERAKSWCEDASKLTGKKWEYLKVPMNVFYNNIGEKSITRLKEIIRSYEEITHL
ncbi:MAG: DEAD/DEAH box helicase family protein, partial [Nitrososphaerota archaeon]